MLSKAPTVDDAMFGKGYEQVLNFSCRGSFHLNKKKVFQKKKWFHDDMISLQSDKLIEQCQQ